MFLGEFEHTIDEKGRVAIPARFRDELREENELREGDKPRERLVVTRGFDRCLQAFPHPIWQALAQRISALSLGNEEARGLRRLIFSGAAELDVDRQGRILIPQNLRDYAGLAEQVLIAGMNTYFELWSRERWQHVLEELDGKAPAVAEHLAALDI